MVSPLDRSLHVRHFFRTFVDQQYDENHFREVGADAVCDRLQQHGFTGSRRSHNQTTLAFTDRCHQIHDPCTVILAVRRFQTQAFLGIQRRQVVEENFVFGLVRVFKVDGLDFQQCKIPFVFLWADESARKSYPRYACRIGGSARVKRICRPDPAGSCRSAHVKIRNRQAGFPERPGRTSGRLFRSGPGVF